MLSPTFAIEDTIDIASQFTCKRSNHMKKLLLIVPLLLCACAPAITRVDLPGSDQSISVPVEDLRPENEKKTEIFSSMVTSSGYGIYRMGDETLEPSMTSFFRRLVFEKLGG
jgi:hypothetical protein